MLENYVDDLKQLYSVREELTVLKDYIQSCNDSDKLVKQTWRSAHLMNEIHVVSIHDIEDLKSGDLLKKLRDMASQFRDHVLKCKVRQTSFTEVLKRKSNNPEMFNARKLLRHLQRQGDHLRV